MVRCSDSLTGEEHKEEKYRCKDDGARRGRKRYNYTYIHLYLLLTPARESLIRLTTHRDLISLLHPTGKKLVARRPG